MQFKWSTKEETERWAKDVARSFVRPCVVLLSGPLGAGKTQLVRWFLEELKIEGAQSPTYAIHQSYPSAHGVIDHVDLYRVKSDQDLESSGFWDLFVQPNGLVFVEWPERLPDSSWPKKWKKLRIQLSAGSGEQRAVTMTEL